MTAIGPEKMIRTVDTGTNAPIIDPGGKPDFDATDYLEAQGNATAREFTLTAKNDGEDPVGIPLILIGQELRVTAHTATYALLAEESGSMHTNTGAGGAIEIDLPPATVGLFYHFGLGAAQELRIDPNLLENISLPLTGVPGADGKWLMANVIGESITLACLVAGIWFAIGGQTPTGIWTAEA